MISFNLYYFFTYTISKFSHGLGLQSMNSEGAEFSLQQRRQHTFDIWFSLTHTVQTRGLVDDCSTRHQRIQAPSMLLPDHSQRYCPYLAHAHCGSCSSCLCVACRKGTAI